jgi:hypothetical protein
LARKLERLRLLHDFFWKKVSWKPRRDYGSSKG